MEPMSFWQLLENNPEWVAVISSTIFALVTTGIVIWQVFVMKAQVRVMRWQGRSSARHERIQNRLLRLQHEHEWVLRRNQEREQLLKLARKLHLAAGCLDKTPSSTDQISWNEVRDTVFELSRRMSILDVGIYTGAYDQWFSGLEDYVDAVQQAMIDDKKVNDRFSMPGGVPNLSTRKALKDIDSRFEPIKIFLDLEAAIRMEFFEFKKKWDAESVALGHKGNQWQGEVP
jgi:hypothetical protein